MVRAKIEAGKLRSCIEPVTKVVDRATLEFYPDELRVEAVDEGDVGMVNISIPSSEFEQYNCGGEKIGIDLDRLKKIAKKASSGGQSNVIDITHEEDNSEVNLEVERYRFHLSTTQIDEGRTRSASTINPPCEISIAKDRINEAVDMANMFSESIVLGTDQNGQEFYVRSEGDVDNMILELGEEELLKFQPSPANSMFSLDYLSKMIKSVPSGTAVDIHIGEDMPIKIEFDLLEEGEVVYGLAPRIE